MTVIKDGAGTGSVAQVNELNMLSTESMILTDAAVGADLGQCWVVDGQAVITSGLERTVLVITNSGTTQVEIGLTLTSVQNNPMNSGLTTTIKTYIGSVGVVTTSGGVTKTPVNMNTQYTTLPNVGIASGSPIVTGTDVEVTQYYFQMQDTLMIDWQSSIVLNQFGSYRVTATGAAGTASGLVNHSVRFVNEFH